MRNHEKHKQHNCVMISFQSNIIAIIMSKLLNYKIIIRANQSPINYAKNFIKRKIMSFFYKLADKIIVNSNDFRKEFTKFFHVRSVTIYNLIETQNTLRKRAKQKIKNNFFSRSKNTLNILTIGRLVIQKDQITILRALNLIKHKKQFRFYLIGKGKELNNLKNFITKHKLNDKVKILNYQNNVYPYYKNADLFILSSLYEGLPNTLIEALSLGVPIISSDCQTGPREIINKNNLGKLFKIGDYKNLSNLILKSKKKRKTNYSNDIRFNFEKNLQKYKNLINNL